MKDHFEILVASRICGNISRHILPLNTIDKNRHVARNFAPLEYFAQSQRVQQADLRVNFLR